MLWAPGSRCGLRAERRADEAAAAVRESPAGSWASYRHLRLQAPLQQVEPGGGPPGSGQGARAEGAPGAVLSGGWTWVPALALPGRLGSPGGAWLDHDKLRGSCSPICLGEPLSC